MQQDPTPTRSVACFRLTVPERGWLFGLALVLASYAIDVSAQSTAAWRPEGPAPNTLGQTENVVPDDEVSGAVNAVVTHPTNADILWIGAVNGGIWRTDNATATSPTWVRQTDLQRSLSIGALALDPSDATHNTLIAGVGIFSSLGFDKGGDRSGLLRTTNGGATWTSIGADLITSNITGVVVDDNVIVASADFSNPNIFSQVGLFRSTDFGATFTQISGAAGTGLDAAQVLDLAQDPINRNRLFVSTRFSQAAGGDGIFRSLDFGLTWERVSNGAIDGFLNANPVEIGRVEISVGRFGEVYVVVPINGVAVGLFRSANGGSNWVRMDTPRVHEGGQGGIHMSIAADPTDASIVYIGGDRQDLTQFPNAIGAFDFSGLLVRCDAQVAPGFQCVHLTHSRDLGPAGGGTLSSSAPHADSRELTFDAAGNLIDGNDGGVYKRTFPRSDTGDWFSIIGNLASAELHDIAYDSNSNTIIGGAQDTGTPAQPSSGASRWFSVATADGGDVAVDDTSTPGIAVRYSSFQNLGAFRRQTRNAANELLSEEFASLQVVSGPSLIVTFSQPYELNLVDPDRMLIHAFAAAYESFDRGDTLTAISVDAIFDNNRIGADPLAYGARNNPDIVYLSGTPDRIFVRTGPPGSAVVQSTSYPGTGSGRFIIDIALDPADGNDAFVVDDERVFRTVNAGASWSDITGNLRTLDPGRLRSNVFIENSLGDAIAVGTDRGVFMALASSGFTSWVRLGSALPNAPVFDLDYDQADDFLVAGLLGRGAFSLAGPVGGGNTPPIVSISAPADGAVFDFGTAINFTGGATDAQDGDLTSQIAWTADGIGFGSGGSASISTLAIGAHTINASVTDSGGQSATDTITVTVRDAAGVEGLDEDFESGAGGWTAEGLWHLVSSSGCSPGFNSPVSAFYYGSDAGCSYDSGAANQGSLVSPRISGIGAASTLSFAYRRQVESFNGDFDRTQVGISIDDGATFTEVFTLNATDPSQNAWISSPFISLTAFAGEAIRVRFLFDTVDATANGFLGWMIDDVLVTADTGSGSPPTVTINSPADGSTFDEGTAVTFAGTATDPEDGDLSAAIQWSVNGGAVATGSTFTSTLPLGANAVSASVTDSTGQAASDAITVNVQPVVAGDCLFDASFAAGADGFNFIDDPQTPAYTDGSLGAGTLEASAGGVDDADITDMIATWQRTCTNDTSRPVTLTVEASLTQSQDYESNELSELRLLVNGSTTVLATLVGDGNGPPEQTTGLQTFTADVNLPAGANTLAVACFNNLKTFNNELTTCSIDRVAVVDAGGPSGGCANGVSLHEARFETGTDGWTTDPAESCATGTFVVGTPDAVSNGGVQTQVGGAATGSGAFFTQPNTGGVGTDDVDAGQCSSLSPVIDTAGFANVEISFNYFHGQRDAGDDALDFFVVELSTDGGTTFQQALVSSVDQTSNAAWTPLSSMLPGGSTIRLRVRAGDGVGETDLVEAGLDDVLVCGLN